MGKKKRQPKVEKDKLKEAIKNEHKKPINAKPEDKPEGVTPHILQIENQQSKAEEKPKEAKGEVQTEKKARVKRKSSVPDNFTEENVLAKMKELGGKDITSTMIKDAFKLSNESGRGTTRRMMKKLEKNNKVKIHLKKDVKRRQYLYDLMNNPGHVVYDPTKERALKRR